MAHLVEKTIKINMQDTTSTFLKREILAMSIAKPALKQFISISISSNGDKN